MGPFPSVRCEISEKWHKNFRDNFVSGFLESSLLASKPEIAILQFNLESQIRANILSSSSFSSSPLLFLLFLSLPIPFVLLTFIFYPDLMPSQWAEQMDTPPAAPFFFPISFSLKKIITSQDDCHYLSLIPFIFDALHLPEVFFTFALSFSMIMSIFFSLVAPPAPRTPH